MSPLSLSLSSREILSHATDSLRCLSLSLPARYSLAATGPRETLSPLTRSLSLPARYSLAATGPRETLSPLSPSLSLSLPSGYSLAATGPRETLSSISLSHAPAPPRAQGARRQPGGLVQSLFLSLSPAFTPSFLYISLPPSLCFSVLSLAFSPRHHLFALSFLPSLSLWHQT